MAQTFYPQSKAPEPTMTVGELIKRLSAFDPAAPVAFRSPPNGCYGPDTAYTIERAEAVSLEAREENVPAGSWLDDDTGEVITSEAYTEAFPAWAGVVIT